MISELKIRNFKSLESVDLKLGHFNLLVGANASGKSNFLDALRFLQGIGNGFSLDEILDGKPPSEVSVRWPGIQGGSKSVAFRKPDATQEARIEFHATLSGPIFLANFGGDVSFHTQAIFFFFWRHLVELRIAIQGVNEILPFRADDARDHKESYWTSWIASRNSCVTWSRTVTIFEAAS